MTPTPLPRVHTMTMPDGIRLGGLLWDVDDAAGIVLLRTPYDARRHTETGRSWAGRGYHCLIQDVRGRHLSSGEWDPYQHETIDGAEVIAQLRTHFPGLPLIAFGASYAAHAALEGAYGAMQHEQSAPDGIIVLVPALGLAETAWNPDGTPQIEHRIAWWHEHGIGRQSQEPLSPAALATRVRRAEQVGVISAAREWHWPTAVFERWERLWKARHTNVRSRYAELTAPLLVVTGAHDFFDADARRLAASWPSDSHLVTGPWGHRLAADLTDPHAREQFDNSGGIGGIIDGWLRAYTPFAARIGRLEPSRYVSAFDPDSGSWQQSRTAA
ncbi:hypothetical protein D1O33_25925 (plasmid) [Rhodococcus rhodochrous]|uniref:CocE/NonD family hydrolase n=1 Tax=Rhodococcus rhodochrous TaxID=1829 RepID=A0AAW4XMI4_RHORH|nr:CocE/NonD family hydrolase [Rhodococcus rhodochrous]MCD2114436.1 CocE/NonD family hydrolase [Rhodococcus rhodochrous]QHG85453.1 hypothetical protein D1O33_25925 [Rhodococcus rhodochrous]